MSSRCMISMACPPLVIFRRRFFCCRQANRISLTLSTIFALGRFRFSWHRSEDEQQTSATAARLSYAFANSDPRNDDLALAGARQHHQPERGPPSQADHRTFGDGVWVSG